MEWNMEWISNVLGIWREGAYGTAYLSCSCGRVNVDSALSTSIAMNHSVQITTTLKKNFFNQYSIFCIRLFSVDLNTTIRVLGSGFHREILILWKERNSTGDSLLRAESIETALQKSQTKISGHVRLYVCACPKVTMLKSLRSKQWLHFWMG